jgi:uncharacterized protein Usg
MKRLIVAVLVAIMGSFGALFATAQQLYRLPDIRSMKRLTTSRSDHAPDIPGKETMMDFYSTTDGTIVTIYTFNGRTVAFSTHKNSDIQGTYRAFLDTTGNGLFQNIGKQQWQLPAWVRQPR